MVKNVILQAALAFRAAGLSVIPCEPGSKSPVGYLLPADEHGSHTWDPFKETIADEATVQRWFTKGDHAVAIVGGRVSGNLERIDHDAPELYQAWANLVESESPTLLARLPLVRTPRGGVHVYYRCEVIEGNQKLARRPKASGWETLVETRGEGGYCLAPPTAGYKMLSGKLTEVPSITLEERAILLDAARAFSEHPGQEVIGPQPKAGRNGYRPGDDFNERGDLAELLGRHGWTEARRFEHEGRAAGYWRRPGKALGWSATWNAIPGRFYVFSSNAAPFEAEHAYSPFAVYALLEHGGSFEAAARALAARGYGEPGKGAAATTRSEKKAPEPAEEAGQVELPKPTFEVSYVDGAPILSRWRVTNDGASRYLMPIARFVPRIVGETVRHQADGEVARHLDLEVSTWRSRVVKSIAPDVLADPRRFYAACVGAVGADARLLERSAHGWLPLAAAELAPGDRPCEVVYEVTGWQEVDGRLCYLSPAGGVKVPSGIRVDLSSLEAGIGLAQDGLAIGGVSDRGDQALAEGVQALLSSVIDSFPRSVTLPALGFVFLAPLMHWSPIPDRPGLHMIGSTGTRKTALLGLLQAFYGCPRFLLSWQSTGNHLEIAMSHTRDMLVTVDDYKATTADRGVGRRVLQAYADRRGRGRATSRGELARARFAGGLLVSAGEDMPEGEASIIARSLFVTIRRGDANLEQLTEAQRAAPVLSTVTARYIAWLLEQGEQAVRDTMQARFQAGRDSYRDALSGVQRVNDAGRVASSCGLILTGIQFMLDFLRSVGASSAEIREEMQAHARLKLLELAHSQALVMGEETYAQVFLSAVRALLDTHQLFLVPPEPSHSLPSLESVNPPGSYPPAAKVAGWKLAEGEVWLDPEIVWGEVAPWLIKQGKILPSRQGTYHQLDDLGVIVRRSGQQRTYVVKIGGRSTRVLALAADAIEEAGY